jgi:putative nucleotidyltransferase with HDIG domain
MVDLEKLVAQANEMAPLPESSVRLARLIGNAKTDISELVDIIKYDAPLTGRLLRASNSAVAAGDNRATTAEEAVMRLGTGQLLALAMAVGTKPLLNPPLPAYGYGEGGLWRHSVAAAVAAEFLPRFSRLDVPPEAFTAALLHDIGKIVMNRFLSAEILLCLKQAEEVDHLSRIEAEKMLLHVHHGELGGMIARHWGLPDRMAQAIAHHHDPEAGKSSLCDFTYVANLLAKHLEAAKNGARYVLVIPDPILERAGFDSDSFRNYTLAAVGGFEKVNARYSAV